MNHTTLAVSALVLAVGLATPAAGQAHEQMARGAAVTKFCTQHKAMRDALFVDYIQVFGGGGTSATASYMSRVVRRPANDEQAIGRLGKVHDRLMLALRGEKRGCCVPDAELVQANLSTLCDLHQVLHQAFAAGKPRDIRSLRTQIDAVGPDCPHGA